MPTASNILAASVDRWHGLTNDENEVVHMQPVIVSTGADRQVHVLETAPGHTKLKTLSGLSDSPVLSFVSILDGRYVLLANMSGRLLLQQGSNTLDSRKDHNKYVIKIIVHEEKTNADSTSVWIATAGWDANVFLYKIEIMDNPQTAPTIGEPVAQIKLSTNPESLVFVRHEDSGELILLVSRRDSTYIYYYQVNPSQNAQASDLTAETTSVQPTSPPQCLLLGRQNLAPHSNAWIAFSPAYMAINPQDSGLLAVATSTLPHLKVMVVRLLFPSTDSLGTSNPSATDGMTQATQAFEALAVQNREDAAIVLQANTFAPQTAYSTPQVAWRPDGSGIWVNGDDGVVRGIETKTGKVITMLKNGHEPGCKVRTIWAGYVNVPGDDASEREEWVISGGFDKRLIIWKI